MKRKYILKSKLDFKKLLSKKKTISSSVYIIYFSKNNLTSNNRFGISISKKRCKKAVDRNKVRRQIKNMLNDLYKTFVFKLDILIVVKENFFLNSYEKNFLDLKKLLNNNLKIQ